MVLINHATRELTAKVVYYGPGLCGKTTNLNYVYEILDEDQRGPMLSLATETDRTLFFDFLPLELGSVRGFRIRLQLYTVPGQVFYEETRKRVLKGADGVVFVADSQRSMAEANREAFRQLHDHLKENGLDPDQVPLVLQYNKRDLGDILGLEELDRDLNPSNVPIFEAVATQGVGVEDTLRAISRLVLKNLMAGGADEREAPPAPAPQPPRMVPAPLPPVQTSPFGASVEEPSPEAALEAGQPFALEEQTDETATLLAAGGGALETFLAEPVPAPAGPPTSAPAEEAVEPAPPAQASAPEGAELQLESGRPLEITVLMGGRRFRLRIQIEEERE